MASTAWKGGTNQYNELSKFLKKTHSTYSTLFTSIIIIIHLILFVVKFTTQEIVYAEKITTAYHYLIFHVAVWLDSVVVRRSQVRVSPTA